MEMHDELSTFCPAYHRAVELIGRRWTGAILRALLADVKRFNDLAAAVPGLSDRMLAERLRELEAEGVVIRRVIPATPVRVEYTLTEKGRALESVVRAVAEWVGTWPDEHPPEPAVQAPAGASRA
jgi:DNA-binding HxlR family transcriptional regulator